MVTMNNKIENKKCAYNLALFSSKLKLSLRIYSLNIYTPNHGLITC